MALTSVPFTGTNTTDAQYALIAREWQDSGVVDNHGGPGFAVSADSSGMHVDIAAGTLTVRGVLLTSTASEERAVTAADPLPRIDAVVAHLDPIAKTVTLLVLAGTPAEFPVRPTLELTDTDNYDLLLADVAIAAGAVTVSAAAVTDRRTYVGGRVGIWSTATRPAAPRAGRLGLNVTTGAYEYWDGDEWLPLTPATVDNSTRWGGYTLTVSPTTPGGTPSTDRIWIQPTS